jgi:MFS family permease
LLGWTIIWILQDGELEIVHVTHKLEEVVGLLLLVASTMLLSVITTALLQGILPPLMDRAGWRGRMMWLVIGAVLAELLVVLLGLACLVVGSLLQGPSSVFAALVISSMAWVLFAAPLGAASAVLLWQDS